MGKRGAAGMCAAPPALLRSSGHESRPPPHPRLSQGRVPRSAAVLWAAPTLSFIRALLRGRSGHSGPQPTFAEAAGPPPSCSHSACFLCSRVLRLSPSLSVSVPDAREAHGAGVGSSSPRPA